MKITITTTGNSMWRISAETRAGAFLGIYNECYGSPIVLRASNPYGRGSLPDAIVCGTDPIPVALVRAACTAWGLCDDPTDPTN